jgi:hypothetical protein
MANEILRYFEYERKTGGDEALTLPEIDAIVIEGL